MKKILIIGPFGNKGGRDFEAQLIASSLEKSFEIGLLSTGYISQSYERLDILKKTQIKSLNKLLFKRYLIYRIIAYVGYLKNGFKKSPEAFINSKISKKYLNFEQNRINELENQIKKNDFVFLVVQLTSKFVHESLTLCAKYKIPCVIRTTGTIQNFDDSLRASFEKAACFIHHSERNAKNLLKYFKHNYKIIDQCAIGEEILLRLPIDIKKPLRFGYLGRLSPEKQIVELAQFFNSINDPLIIAGEGPLEEEVNHFSNTGKNIDYIGFVDRNNLDDFFNKIDVLIVSSKEEAGPLVALEAMAAGKILITTNVGAMKERIKGYTIPFLDTDFKNLQQILDYLNDCEIPQLNDFALFLRKKYSDFYAINTIKDSYFNLVNNILIENAHR
ncbi:MAG: glycosyltransferase [Flavobacteriaceae bacterium]